MMISACIIAKNEEKNIETCFESLRTIVDEIVLVDTGSTDDTIAIAEKYNAKIYSYSWKNDFAAAKNYAIDQARGEWIIFLDADEYFSDESIQSVKKYILDINKDINCQAIGVKIINIDTDREDQEISSFSNVRIFRNQSNIKYKNAVHEELFNTNGVVNIYMLSGKIVVYHTGYSSHIVETKLKRNLELILEDIKEHGEQAKHYRYLCDCYHGLHEYEKAIKYGRLHIASEKNSFGNENIVHSKVIDSLIRNASDPKEIKAEIKKAIIEFPDSPEFYSEYGRCAWQEKEYQIALDYYLKSLDVYNSKRKKSYVAESFLGKLSNVYFAIGELYLLKNEKEKAIAFYAESLLQYRYNAIVFKRIYGLISQGEPVEIIAILNNIYQRTHKDIKFIVENIIGSELNEVFVYYSNILTKEFVDSVQFIEQYQLISLKKYQTLYNTNASSLDIEVRLFATMLIAEVDEVAAMNDKAILPKKYQKVVSCFYGDTAALHDIDFIAYKELLDELLVIETGCLEKYLNIENRFTIEQNFTIAKRLEDYNLYEEAIFCYKNILKQFPEDKLLCYETLAYCYYKNENYDEANRLFEKCIFSGRTNNKIVQFQLWCKQKSGDDSQQAIISADRHTSQEVESVMESLTSIIILTHNQLTYTKLCIDSIRQYTTEPYEIIVVDNASVDATAAWLRKQKDIKCIFNKENAGFPKGCNQGIQLAEGTEILLLNNDTIVTKDWLRNLKRALYSDATIGAVGPVTNSCSNYQAIAVPYKNVNELAAFAADYNTMTNPDKWENKTKLVGFCLLVKKSVVDLIGVLDERFTPGNFEDDDYSLRILAQGYQLLVCNDTFIHHYGSVSFKEKPAAYGQLLEKNAAKFKEKWGFEALYTARCQNELLELADFTKASIKVLEVGCGCGATLFKIKYLNKSAELYGVESCLPVAKIAGQFIEITVGNFNELTLPYEENMFDYILLGDILETLYQPEIFLKDMNKYLKPDGFILGTIFNNSYIGTIKNLIHGHGISKKLGNTPRECSQLFTLEAINQIFLKAGYSKNTYTGINVNILAEDQKFIDQLLLIDNSVNAQDLMTYKYLIKAAKNSFSTDQSLLLTQKDMPKITQKRIENLKFVLRRLEYDIDIEVSLNNIMQSLMEKTCTLIQVRELIKKEIYQKSKVVVLISAELYRQDKVEESLTLLMDFYKIYPADADIVYALAAILNLVQDRKTALHILKSFTGEDENIKILLKTVELEN